MTKFHELAISKVEQLTDEAVAIRFDVPDHLQKEFDFEPGQYLTLRTKIDGEDVRRSYSICSASGDGLRVGVKRVKGGRFSSHAQTLSKDDRIEVMPPQGRFVCDASAEENANIILIASGSGITPILSIAKSLLESNPDASITLVYGNRTTASIMFRSELDDLKDRFLERFHVFHVLSRESQDVALLQGRIDAEKINELANKGVIHPEKASAVFICGPGDMASGLKTCLENLGVDTDRVKTELFEAPDRSSAPAISEETLRVAAEGVEVEVILDGLRRNFVLSDGADTVLSAAEKSGLELPFSCAGGMCATCRCRVVEGEADMERNFSLDKWELEAGFVLACQSRPKSGRLVLDFDAA